MIPVGAASSVDRVKALARDDCILFFVERTGSVYVRSNEQINARMIQTEAL